MSKADENRLRRQLDREFGYLLRKSRSRTITGNDFGKYRIVDAATNSIVAGEKYDLDLEDVSQFFLSRREAQKV